jgi:hypothetical protein
MTYWNGIKVIKMANDQKIKTEIINLELNQNTTPSWGLEFKNEDTGARINVSDWTIFFTAKAKATDSDDDAKIKKTLTDHEFGENGIVVIPFTVEDTSTVAEYVYDIKYKDGEGKSDILFRGRLTIVRTITQRSE